jgi:anaerobic ribonucleoside-triphosphate reductase activating protein
MSVIKYSKVNGPYIKKGRTVIWTQGCNKGCRLCYQPESWSYDIKNLYSPVFLASMIKDLNPDGITFTGGDPLEQASELLELLKLIQPTQSFLPNGIICFTGYTIEEIEDLNDVKECLPYIDLLIEGRFIQELKTQNGLHGSSNQRFIWNNNIGRGKDLINESKVMFDQDVEVHVTNGEIQVTGFPDFSAQAKKHLKELGITIRK